MCIRFLHRLSVMYNFNNSISYNRSTRNMTGVRRRSVGVLTITFFTWLCAFELHHIIALRMTFVVVGDTIDAAHRVKNRGATACENICKRNGRMRENIMHYDWSMVILLYDMTTLPMWRVWKIDHWVCLLSHSSHDFAHLNFTTLLHFAWHLLL